MAANRNRYPPIRRDADGRMLCRGCGSEIPPGRQTWCSKECYKTLCPREIEKALFRRDRGVCCVCCSDAHSLRRRFRQLYWNLRGSGHPWRVVWMQKLSRWQKRNGWPRVTRRWWEADHIVEYAKGGSHRLENRQTLCVRCHKKKSNQFMQERRTSCSPSAKNNTNSTSGSTPRPSLSE